MHAEDCDEWWQAIWCDADVTRYLPCREPIPRDRMPALMLRAEQRWEEHGLGVWSVRYKQQGSLLGHCGLLINEPPHVELIYAFTRTAWGHGFATEAARCVTNYAFEQRDLKQLVALVFPENLASIRVLEKLGFIRAGETERFDVQLLRYILRK